jgi:O-antigen/teichoic acid export membrane protein
VRVFLREFSIVGMGAALSRGASLLTLVILTRHLAPPEFGVFSIGWAVYLLVSQLVSGFDLGYVDLEARHPVTSLQSSYFRIKLVAAAAVVVLAIVLPVVCGEVIGWSGPLVQALIVAGLAGAVWSVFQSNLSSYRAHREFGRFAFWTVVFNVGVAVLVAVLVAFDVRSPTAFLGCYLASGLAAAGLLPLLQRERATPSTRDDRRLIIRHSRWLVVSSVLFSIGDRIELLIAAGFLTAFELGVYAAPARLFGLFSFFLSSMGTVLLPHASQLRDHRQFRSYIRRSLVLTGGVAVFAALVALASHPLTRLVLGETYISATALVPAFCISAVLLTGQATLMYLLFSVGRPGAFALLNGLVLTSRVVAALVLIPLVGAKGAAWSLALSYAVGALFIGLFVLAWRRGGVWASPEAGVGGSDDATGDVSV